MKGFHISCQKHKTGSQVVNFYIFMTAIFPNYMVADLIVAWLQYGVIGNSWAIHN